MKKIVAITILTAMLFSGTGLVQAKPDREKQGSTTEKGAEKEYNLPEEDGIYDVPNHPELKVKVFVYKERGRKPKPTPRPTPTPTVTPTPTPSSTPTPTPTPSATPTPMPTPSATPIPTPSLSCGLSDTDSTAVVAATGWHLPVNGAWTYRLNPASMPSSIDPASLSVISQLGFNAWSLASNSKVTFTKGANTIVTKAGYDGQNIIAWGTTSASALAVTYTTYYTATGIVADVDTIMNRSYVWTWADQTALPACAYTDSYDAQDILTHELGHWMGLDDHYTDAYANNTMYGYGSKSEVKKNTLTTGDISGINNIYSSL